MVYENFTTYSETDPNNVLSQTATRATWAHMDRNYDAWIKKDYGDDHFGDFDVLFQFILTELDGGDDDIKLILFLIVFSKTDDITAPDDALLLYATQNHASDITYDLTFFQKSGGANKFVIASSDGTLDVGTTYYARITKSGNVMRCYIYDDAARTSLVWDSNNRTGVDDSYKYIQSTKGGDYAADPNDWSSGYLENLDLQEVVAAEPAPTKLSLTLTL